MIQGKSLLRLTAERLKPLLQASVTTPITLVTAAEHRFLACDAMNQASVESKLLLEPAGRNTAPAILAAAIDLERRAGPEALMLVVPADNFIPDAEAFARSVWAGIEQAKAGWWVIAGVVPSFPATGYGYIALDSEAAQEAMRAGSHPACAYPIKGFVEKPTLDRAQATLVEGGDFWNAGIFPVSARTAIDSAKMHCPGMLEQLNQAFDESTKDLQANALTTYPKELNDLSLGKSFSNAQSISIDYAVLEPRLSTIPTNAPSSC